MITFILILIGLSSIILVVQYYALRRVKYTCMATATFRQLRYEATKDLLDAVMTEQDSRDITMIQGFVGAANFACSHFEHVKSINHLSIKHIISNVIVSSEQANRLEIISGTPIADEFKAKYHDRYTVGLRQAITAVPFAKWGFVLQLFKLIAFMLMVIGLKKFNVYIKQFERFLKVNKSIEDNHCFTS